MARRALLYLAVAAAASACSGDGTGDDADPGRSDGVAYAEVEGRELLADVYRPERPSGASAVVLHGQGGSRSSTGSVALAERLRDRGGRGVVVDYQTRSPREFTSDGGAGLARASQQARCAVRFARRELAAATTTRSIIVGESAGGLVGLVAATGVDAVLGDPGTIDCDSSGWPVAVDGLVSWNGAVFIHHPQSPFHDERVWGVVNPDTAVAAVPELELWLGLGGQDDRTPRWHVDLVTEFADRFDGAHLAMRPTAGHELPDMGADLDAVVELVVEAATAPTDR